MKRSAAVWGEEIVKVCGVRRRGEGVMYVYVVLVWCVQMPVRSCRMHWTLSAERPRIRRKREPALLTRSCNWKSSLRWPR